MISYKERELAEAREHVALGRRHISDQQQRIAHLLRGGHRVEQSEVLLATFQETQMLHEQHAVMIERELQALLH